MKITWYEFTAPPIQPGKFSPVNSSLLGSSLPDFKLLVVGDYVATSVIHYQISIEAGAPWEQVRESCKERGYAIEAIQSGITYV